ncbi:putative DNA-binding domain-containing protein [Chromobacterium sp. IIBBL 290-4]|uniref:HvfC/BufC family peptide modification chaperone n=1 Tax=Chromobacterium sp. IIBBL 290-4 TaxID=2953890 RepID=UPI0020B86DC3|nr:putative DNA-binding domain-containing protein [Chromobacterium sp. IIBBL 290-4]UTH73513.1 putative DNA-binding domain-containing protein [Chromobacterium sp. IIBBL 290-4]
MDRQTRIECFSRQLRTRAAKPPSPSVELYREFVCGNIEEALTQVFPLFCEQTGEDQLADMVDAFLAEHGAQSPAFHHIATEFLCFMQTRLPLPLRQCLEYEWVLLRAEIDDADVRPPSDSPLPGSAALALNPTLICIELQLSGIGLDGAFAIYRDARHQVAQKPLSQLDRWMLGKISQGAMPNELIAQSALDAATIRGWLSDAYAAGLINTSSGRA